MAEFCNSEKNAVLENEEFQEEDVWAVMKGRAKTGNKERSSPSSASACRIFPATPRGIPRVKSGSFESQQGIAAVHPQSSAPVNIPDWAKIHKRKSSSRINDNQHEGAERFGGFLGNADASDEEEDTEELVPPHEFIARRLARTPIVSFSMCEGIGRTLKGRDLSRLRNAILAKTGFLE